MEYSDFLNGYLKSGGWRFGGKPTSTDTFKSLYTPEAYNGGLLDQVGNPNKKGPVTSAVTASPVSTAVTTGLLSNDRGGGRDFDRTSGPHGNGTNLSDRDWGTAKDMRNAYGGFNNPFDRASFASLGKAAVNPVGTVIEAIYNGITGKKTVDPAIQALRDFQRFQADPMNNYALGQASQDYLGSIGIAGPSGIAAMSQKEMDQVNRDIASWASMGGGGGGGGGFTSTDGGYGGGNVGGGYTGAGADRD